MQSLRETQTQVVREDGAVFFPVRKKLVGDTEKPPEFHVAKEGKDEFVLVPTAEQL